MSRYRVGSRIRYVPPSSIYIYALRDPETHEIRYIGQSVDPVARLRGHVSGHDGNAARRLWTHGLRQRGLYPYLEIVGIRTNKADAIACEQEMIAQHRSTVLNVGEDSSAARSQPHAPSYPSR